MSGPLSRALAGLLFVLMLVPGVSAASDDGMLVPDSAHAAAESETASVKRLRLAIVNSYGMSIMDDYYSRTIEAVKEKLIDQLGGISDALDWLYREIEQTE